MFTDLKQLPSIGNSLVKNIITFRQKTPFTSFDDLLNVPGLGRVILNRIKPFIGLNNTLNYWTVTQSPDNDGSVIDCVTGKQYPYLFWESIFEEPIFTLNKQRSFCVKKHDLFHFLTEKLSILCLNANESKAFIEFWVPL